MAQQLTNLTRIHENVGSIPGLSQCVRIWCCLSCGVGHRGGLGPSWLWCRLAAVALIRPLAWEPPYAAGVALKSKNKKKTNKKKQKQNK